MNVKDPSRNINDDGNFSRNDGCFNKYTSQNNACRKSKKELIFLSLK
jgi:hypothetical protein